LKSAEDAGLDLVEVSPNAEPPVAKIIDWGKYQYQKMKEQQRNKRSSRGGGIKQMKLGLKIGAGDLDVKMRKIESFLAGGDKVKIIVMFRGREMAHKEVGDELMKKILGILGDSVIVESAPSMSGRNLSATVRSNNHAKTKNA
jgi:translation initiation factor IF-3